MAEGTSDAAVPVGSQLIGQVEEVPSVGRLAIFCIEGEVDLVANEVGECLVGVDHNELVDRGHSRLRVDALSAGNRWSHPDDDVPGSREAAGLEVELDCEGADLVRRTLDGSIRRGLEAGRHALEAEDWIVDANDSELYSVVLAEVCGGRKRRTEEVII